MDAAAPAASPSQPRVPDSRLPGVEPAATLEADEAGRKEAEDKPKQKEEEPRQPLVVEEEADYDFSVLALWPVFVMVTFAITLTVATAWYGPKKVLMVILQYLVPPRPHFGHAVAIWLAIVVCITLGIPVLLLLLPVPTMMFGFGKGFIITATAETAAACLSFVIGRYIAQRPVRRFLEGRGCKRIMRLLHVLEDDEDQSMQLLVLYRFITMPMAARNYGPAILRVPIPMLVVSSIPHSLWSATVFATAGSALKGPAQLLRDGHKIAWRTPHWQQVIGLLIALLSFTAFSWIAYRAYSRRVEVEEGRRQAAVQTLLLVKGSEEGSNSMHYGTNAGMAVEVHTSDS